MAGMTACGDHNGKSVVKRSDTCGANGLQYPVSWPSCSCSIFMRCRSAQGWSRLAGGHLSATSHLFFLNDLLERELHQRGQPLKAPHCLANALKAAALPVGQMGKKRTQTGETKAVDTGDAELLLQQAVPTEQDDGLASPLSDLTADHTDVDSEVDIDEDSEGGGSDDGFGPESAEDNDEETEDSDEATDEEVDAAIVDYAQEAAARSAPGETSGREQPTPAASSPAEQLGPITQLDAGSDSSEDEREPRNTVGDVPLRWYKDEEHIGYSREGAKLLKRERGDQLDALLQRNDLKLPVIYDEYNDTEIQLSKEELQLIQRIRQGRFPHVEVNPFEPETHWYTNDKQLMPLSARPEPKRRFRPSQWEEKKIVKLVRALRKGWIQRDKPAVDEEPKPYLLWADDGQATGKTATGLAYVPAPKPKLPGHEESYNPPKEYLPTEEERSANELLDDDEKAAFVPIFFDSLRRVPAYASFINERFERCLDLYLCPRTRKKRLDIDPESLVPRLPKPADLQPFPTTLLLRYIGHTGRVRNVAPDASGQHLASGSDDGTLRLWEVRTGRCLRSWDLGAPVHSVAWCPNSALQLLAAAVGSSVVLLAPGLGNEEVRAATAEALQLPTAAAAGTAAVAAWRRRPDGEGLEVVHQHPVTHVAWHSRGDYFASVAPTGNTQAVQVHQLSKRSSQNPFRKNRGRVVRVLFHPLKPFLFVATQNHVRIYNLAKQELAKKLIGASGIASMAVHSSGDHVLVGCEDRRVLWYDLDLSTKPYKALKYHQLALRAVAFHKSYPLFASASDDGTIQVFHGMVYQDLMTNPLIVPVKILRGHEAVHRLEGVFDCTFHPTQPWVFSAGADSTICLFSN